MNNAQDQSYNIEDIRRVRKEAEIRYKGMTSEEISKNIYDRALPGYNILEEIRKEKTRRQGA